MTERDGTRRMRIGLNLGYVTTASDFADNLALAQAAEELGFDTVWAAEAYGSDAVTVLAAVAARTTRIDIGSAVLQIPGRTPTLTAMTAASLDCLSGGRFRLGLGVSGPQVSEGWHGVRFTDPVGRTREYVQIVRQALQRRRVTAGGEHYTLPLPDGPGKALVLSLQPLRPDIPIYLAALGPKNLDLTGRVADGWLGIFFDPDTGSTSVRRIRDAAESAGRDPADLDLCASVAVAVADDPRAAADAVRGHAALYIGGMGPRRRTSTTGRPARWVTSARPTRCRTVFSRVTTRAPRRRSRTSSSIAPACSGTPRASRTGSAASPGPASRASRSPASTARSRPGARPCGP